MSELSFKVEKTGNLSRLYNGDCLEVLKTLSSNSIDSIVTDPPAGIAFMGKDWDNFSENRHNFIEFMENIFRECIRVLKPGGYALVWALPRTSHWTGTALENAGFEIRDEISNFYNASDDFVNLIDSLDEHQKRLFAKAFNNEAMIAQIFGQGFPKSLDISKAIDKKLKVEREVIGTVKGCGKQNSAWNGKGVGGRKEDYLKPEYDKTIATSDEAKQWSGWGTALKPAHEIWWLVRKPLSEKSVAENVLKHGVGGINIDECRIAISEEDKANYDFNNNGLSRLKKEVGDKLGQFDGGWKVDKTLRENDKGRFPSNVILSHSEGCKCVGIKQVKAKQLTAGKRTIKWGVGKGGDTYKKGDGVKYETEDGLDIQENWECVDDCPIKMLDEQSGNIKTNRCENPSDCGGNTWGGTFQTNRGARGYSDVGGASRFFYCAKSSRKERNEGCEDLEEKSIEIQQPHNSKSLEERYEMKAKNHHPTVKPIKLMEYLVKLITPIGGVVLDTFMGSGTTGIACIKNEFEFIGIEKNEEYFEIAKKRIGFYDNKSKKERNKKDEKQMEFEL